MTTIPEAVYWDENKYIYWITKGLIQHHPVKNGEYSQMGEKTRFGHYRFSLDSGRVCSHVCIVQHRIQFWADRD